MPTRKIGDLVHPSVAGAKTCRDSEHNPPSHIVLENGIYEHECPGCGYKRTFTVNKPSMVAL